MAQVITRVYSSHQTATEVVEALKKGGFGGIHLVAPPPADAESPDAASTVAAIHEAGLSKGHADAYAKAVHAGGTLVSVEAPFGGAGRITSIMDSFHPVEHPIDEVHATEPDRGPSDMAAPLSSWLGWKTILHDPAPFSRMLGWSTLKEDAPDSATRAKVAAASDDPAPFSSKLGWKTLSDDPSPLSTALGWKTLMDNPAPLSSALGWSTLSNKPPSATLSDDPAPLSTKLGWSTLCNEPAPFSKKLGWKVLSDEKTPE